MTITAQNVIAATPFGQALTIQNSEITPDREQDAHRVDKRRHPVGDVQMRPSFHADNVAGVDHAGEAVESAGHAEHAGRRVIRQQPLHRRFSLEVRQRPHRRAAGSAQFRRLIGRTRCA